MAKPLTLEIRPLQLSGEKAYPPDMAGLYARLRQDIKVTAPDSQAPVYVGNTQPADVNGVWIKLSSGGNYAGTYVFVKGRWTDTSLKVGTMAWFEGRPDRFKNGEDGWWVADGENNTIDMKEYFVFTDDSTVTKPNKNFRAFWDKMLELTNNYRNVDGADFDDMDSLVDQLNEWMKAESECDCKDGDYDPAKVKAFIAVYKGGSS